MADASSRQYAYFRVVERGGTESILVFDTQEVSVGRSKESDLRSESTEMSRRHAMLNRSKTGCSISNYSTSNSTLVNGDPIKTHMLQDGDVVTIADLELTFCLGSENPAGLGLKIDYASALKGFGPATVDGDGEATVLGMLDPVTSEDGEFDIRPAGEFEPGMRGTEGAREEPRDLDLELDGFGLDDIESGGDELVEDDLLLESDPVTAPAERPAPAKPTAPKPSPEPDELKLEDEAWTLDEPKAQPVAPEPHSAGTLSLHLELEGLTPDLQKVVGSLLGKVIELPNLRIRIKSDDLG